MRLTHNLASLNVYKEYSRVLKHQGSALQQISSGVKLSSSKDNPNAIAASEKINMQIRGLQMSSRNLQDGVSMLQTAEGGMNEITSMLQRVKELTEQAGDGGNSPSDKEIIQGEIKQTLQGIDDIASQTNFNDIKILGDFSGKVIPMAIGANEGESIDIPTYNLKQNTLGSGTGNYLCDIDVTATGGVDKAMSIIDDALSTVISARSRYGAYENRFESAMSESIEISDKLDESDSRIKDADVAAEIMEYSKDNILSEAGNAMMAQTNKMPQDVLKILQNMK